MAGSILIVLIFVLLFLAMLGSLASIGQKSVFVVQDNSVLHLKFNTEIVDRSRENPFESFDFLSGRPQSTIGLIDIIRNLRKAKADDNIKGVFLDLTHVSTGLSSISEIRENLIELKAEGKFIIAYGEMFSQNAYYLASVADEIYLNPVGLLDFRGLNAQMMFFKNMLEKIGVEPQIIRHGEYKSAGEPFYLEKMSPENREQMQSIISSMWNNVINDISKSRNLSVNHLNMVADNYLSRTPSGALDNSMIDGIKHRDEIYERIRELLEINQDDKINFASFSQYKRALPPKEMTKSGVNDQIAVIFGQGMIISGKGSENNMGSDRIAAAIRKARLDDNVKAIVFRINSGGGSALASDVMLREVILAAKEKPVVASFGDVAASGGYYVACAADVIIANRSTITGSIGVFGMIPNMKELFESKIGLSFDNVKTNELADFASINRPLTNLEREIIKESIGEVYDTFISHVAEGRNLPKETVDNIGRGRVWTGVEAMQVGLIDEFGGLEYAIDKAAELAEIEDFRLIEYPEQKSFFEMLMDDMGGVTHNIIQRELGDSYIYYKLIQDIKNQSGILARMPFEIIIE